MEIFKYPQRADWLGLLQRPTENSADIEKTVLEIMNAVRTGGDKTIKDLTHRIDGVLLDELSFTIGDYSDKVAPALKKAIGIAKQNIEKFHRSQRDTDTPVETTSGVICWRKSVAIQSVGLYIPGGTAPLFSTLLMLAIPAKLAGCKNLVVCTPPQKDGMLHPVIGYVCQLIGIEKVFLTGGAQAVAAMTFGTETIPNVDKIFGPGNQYVTIAKQLAQKQGVAIDMPAGPSEVLVIATEDSNAEFVAADLLSQAEHGPDSQVILVSTSQEKVNEILEAIERQLQDLPRKEVAQHALKNSRAFVVKDLYEAIDLSNDYAPEHLILAFDEAQRWIDLITNAGSVFVGKYACESAGDYASGTNHTLPTNGYAQAYSGVSLDSFVKKITFQKISKPGLSELGPHVEIMAEAEGLQAHKNAVTVRLNALK